MDISLSSTLQELQSCWKVEGWETYTVDIPVSSAGAAVMLEGLVTGDMYGTWVISCLLQEQKSRDGRWMDGRISVWMD